MLDYLSLFRGQRINNNLSTHFVENVTDKLLFNDFDETIWFSKRKFFDINKFHKLVYNSNRSKIKLKRQFNLASSVYFKLWQLDFYRFLDDFVWEYNLKYPTYWKKLKIFFFNKILDSEILNIGSFVNGLDNLLGQFYAVGFLKFMLNDFYKKNAKASFSLEPFEIYLLDVVRKHIFSYIQSLEDSCIYVYLKFCNRVRLGYTIKWIPASIGYNHFLMVNFNYVPVWVIKSIDKWCKEYLSNLFECIHKFCSDKSNVHFLRNLMPFRLRLDSNFENNDLFRLFIKNSKFRWYFREYCKLWVNCINRYKNESVNHEYLVIQNYLKTKRHLIWRDFEIFVPRLWSWTFPFNWILPKYSFFSSCSKLLGQTYHYNLITWAFYRDNMPFYLILQKYFLDKPGFLIDRNKMWPYLRGLTLSEIENRMWSWKGYDPYYDVFLSLRKKILEQFFLDLVLDKKTSSRTFLRREARFLNKRLYLFDKYWFGTFYDLLRRFETPYGFRILKFKIKDVMGWSNYLFVFSKKYSFGRFYTDKFYSLEFLKKDWYYGKVCRDYDVFDIFNKGRKFFIFHVWNYFGALNMSFLPFYYHIERGEKLWPSVNPIFKRGLSFSLVNSATWDENGKFKILNYIPNHVLNLYKYSLLSFYACNWSFQFKEKKIDATFFDFCHAISPNLAKVDGSYSASSNKLDFNRFLKFRRKNVNSISFNSRFLNNVKKGVGIYPNKLWKVKVFRRNNFLWKDFMPFLDIRPKYYLHGFDRSYRGVDLNVSKLSLRKLQFLTAIDHSFLVV